jgi:hypothetical protein
LGVGRAEGVFLIAQIVVGAAGFHNSKISVGPTAKMRRSGKSLPCI